MAEDSMASFSSPKWMVRDQKLKQSEAAKRTMNDTDDEIKAASLAAKIERFERGQVSAETAGRLARAQQGNAAAREALAPPPEDDGLDGNIAAMNNAFDASPMGLIGGQLAGSMQSAEMAKQQWLANQARYSSRTNPEEAFVRERQAEQRGVAFQPEQFQAELPDLPPQLPGESDEEYSARAQTMAEANIELQRQQHEQEQLWAADAAGDVPDDTRLIGTEPGGPGFEEAQRQRQEQVDAATGQRLDTEDQARSELAAKTAEDARVAAEAIEQQQAKEAAGMQAMERVKMLREDARAQLAAMPEINREKVARGLGTGTKVAAVLGAIAQGWQGNPITAVTDAIDRGVADLTDRYQRRATEYQGIVDQQDDEMVMLDYLTNSLGGNVQAAAGMIWEMKAEATLQDFDAKIQAAGTPEAKATLQQARVEFEQKLREQTRGLDIDVMRTPDRVGVTIDTPQMKLERKLAMAAMEAAPKEQAELRKMGVGEASKAADREAGAETARITAQGTVDAKRAEKDAEWENKVKEKTQAWGAVETQIDDILSNTGNIHGVGLIGTGDKDQRITTDSQRIGLKLSITSAWTGANASPEQQEEFNRLVDGDWSEFTDDEFRARLRALKNLVSSQRRALQKPLGSEDKAINNTRELPSFRAR